MGQQEYIPHSLKTLYYDLHYEIDAGKGVFRSTQDIALTNASGKYTDRISFLLHPDFLIDSIALQDAQGRTLSIKGWRLGGTQEIFVNKLQVVEVETDRDIAPGQELGLSLEYHAPPKVFRPSPPESDHILDLTISDESCYAVGPHSGHYVLFVGNIATPFRLTITHSEEYSCCAPGSLVSSKREGGYVVEAYHSQIPNIPAFSCGRYEKTIRQIEGITFEYYLYPGQLFFDEMASFTAQIVQLYTSFLGDLETDTFRFGTVGARDSRSPGWENKGNAIYFTDMATRYYGEDMGARGMFAGLVAHEVYHNWNLFSLHWTGPLAEWFEEGGANFVGAWACERLLGEEAGVAGRTFFARSYDGAQGYRGYDAEDTLASVHKTVGPELMLIYYYGALVWEQLRQKVGDEALFAGLGDFFRRYRSTEVTYQGFLHCLQGRTDVQVADYLDQWIYHNAKIDLSIGKVNTQEREGLYQTEVEILVDSDRDHELLTSIGYKMASQEEMVVINVNVTRKGAHRITFESGAKPMFVQIDPACRVPQVNLDSNTWRAGPDSS